MKITIDTDDVDILERFEDYDRETKDKTHRRWGQITWLHPNDIVVLISDQAAAAIREAFNV